MQVTGGTKLLMRLVRIDVFKFTYSLARGSFTLSGGRVATTQDSTIVKLTTDDGLAGWGETCPFTPNYLPAHGEGARAAIREIGPALIGLDPRLVEVVSARMNHALMGHVYAKSAIDIACWDLLGQATGLPVCDLLGGAFHPEFPVYAAVSLQEPEAMKEDAHRLWEAGYRQLQLKAGGGWREDVARVRKCLEVFGDGDLIIVDANGHWLQHEAVKVVAELNESPVYIEQPCRSTVECAAVRERSNRPFILDESLEDLSDIVTARASRAMDAVRLKLSRLGGITPVRKARDLCQQWGLALTVEDSGGGDIASAAMAHVTASVGAEHLLGGFLVNSMVKEQVADGAPTIRRGRAQVPQGPGLGINVDEAQLGKPVYTLS